MPAALNFHKKQLSRRLKAVQCVGRDPDAFSFRATDIPKPESLIPTHSRAEVIGIFKFPSIKRG
ncbi:MAG: hypothetical protein A2Z50_06650 [Nitrospirae bacterium RBG_19FT_COMBO_42_15]|nr:MAG: hypothetical protein A2Z50_06650 [Nitrospirae bacterium RBG_19FT_COMBO_42_15]